VSVRAKFVVQKIERYSYSPGSARIGLTPVTSGSEENKAFWEATPSGEITMMVKNPNAVFEFELGKAYYVDFTPAE